VAVVLGRHPVGAALREPSMTEVEDDENALEVTQADLALVRRLTVRWDPSESGAPFIFDDPSAGMLPDVSTVAYRAAIRAAEALLQNGKMSPGDYEYEDPLGDELAPFAQSGGARIEGGRVAIDVTEKHLKLLSVANVRLHDDGDRDIAVGIDSKRPYGDMTYFYLDMAAALGISPEGPPRKDRPDLRDFSDVQKKMFDALHEQMQPVVQVFLQHATLMPGHFVRRPLDYGPWRRS
jgi:hypothetical protein